MAENEIGAAYLADVLKNLRGYKKLAEQAIEQVDEPDMFRTIDPEANSIAVLVRHMAGNMRSRWTGFLTSDGEKPDRHRDGEFEIQPGTTRAEVMRWWDSGWRCMFDAIEPLQPEDLLRTVRIRGRDHTVLQAITRQLLHYAGHVNQIVMLAKHYRGAAWKSLSIPRGQSEAYLRPSARELSAPSEK